MAKGLGKGLGALLGDFANFLCQSAFVVLAVSTIMLLYDSNLHRFHAYDGAKVRISE